MKRRRRTAKQRLALLHAHNDTCHLCGGIINPTVEEWHLDHVIALELSGDDSDENLKPAHAKCHRAKQDAKLIAKAKRREIKHAGASAPKQKIQSRGFARKERNPKRTLKPKELFR